MTDIVNIVVLLALPEEHDRFLEQFPHIGECNTERLVRLRHDIGLSDFTLTSVLAENMGSDNAASATYAAIADLNPDLIVCLGIAGALSNDVVLGDVCIASEIIDVLHNVRSATPSARRAVNRSYLRGSIK